MSYHSKNEGQVLLISRSKENSRIRDDFARLCGATFESTVQHARIAAMLEQGIFRVQKFDVLMIDKLQKKKKIGQFTITKGWRCRKFHSGIYFLPEHEHRWREVIELALRTLGDGRYLYGSRFSLEPPRENEMMCIEGVIVRNIHDHVVEAVDFARWATWDHYIRDISANVRRNINSFKNNFQNSHIKIDAGRRFIYQVPNLVIGRYSMYRRKAVRCNPLGMIKVYILRFLSSGRHSYSAALHVDRSTRATYSGIRFGPLDFYMDGASDETVKGCGSFLVLEMLARFYKESPGGKVVLGSDPDRIRSEGTEYTTRHRYRQDLRISYFPTSTVQFDYKSPRKLSAVESTADRGKIRELISILS